MAENLCFCRFCALFILFLPHGSLFSIMDETIWQIHCISLRDHSVCGTETVLQSRQKVCRATDLLEFDDWSFMERSVLLQEFDVDKETRNYVRQVRGVVFSKVHPVPLKYKPYLVAISSDVMTDILDLKTTVSESPVFLEFVAGNKIIPNSILLSHRYGGHQVRFHDYFCKGNLEVLCP